MQQQETFLLEECASFIAMKLHTLLPMNGEDSQTKLPTLPTSTNLMLKVQEKYDDPKSAGSPADKPKRSVVTDVLMPKVVQLDADGRPTNTEHERVSPTVKANEVRNIPWRVWAENACAQDEEAVAKLHVHAAMASMHQHLGWDAPIALTVRGQVIKAVATEDIPIGGLKVPLWFKKPSSMVMDRAGASRHPKAVFAEVSWVLPVTPEEREAGCEGDREFKVKILVVPELKLPKVDGEGFAWTPTDAVHPFWIIKRDGTGGEQSNASMVMEKLITVCASDCKHLKEAKVNAAPSTVRYTTLLPCIVNTSTIRQGQEVVVKWHKPTTEKQRKAPVAEDAFEQLARAAKRAKKGN